MTPAHRLVVGAVAAAALASTALTGALSATPRPAAAAAASDSILQTPAEIMAASAKPGVTWSPGPATYGMGQQLDQVITMADGIKLRADVYFPTANGKAAPGPFPVLLIQTPYGKATAAQAGTYGFASTIGPDKLMVQHGYIDVVADVRGTGDSEGGFGLFDPPQIDDGVRLVKFAAALPHSNGKVGLYGASYLGIDQVRTAGALGKDGAVKAIFPVVTATDLYRDTAFMGGILDAEFGAAYLGLTSGLNVVNPLAQAGFDPASVAGLTPVEIAHLENLYTFDATFIANTLAGGATAYNDTYWKDRLPADSLAQIAANNVPAYFIGGEFDLFQRGEPMNYAALQNLWAGRPANAPMLPGQKVTGRYQLWDGPFTHLTGSAVNIDLLMLRWFDTWLKGIDTGMADTPTPLHYYDLGTKSYTETTTYPFTGQTPTTYYLAAGRSGTLAASANDGTLTTAVPPAGNDTMIWSPVGSPCGAAVDQWAIGPLLGAQSIAGLPNLPCLQDDHATQLGPSILNYTTAPMTSAVTLGGPIAATIYATATTKDTQWVAAIQDVSPDGSSRPLTQGALLGSLRALDASRTWTAADGQPTLPYHPYTKASAQAVTPGAVTRYDVEIFPTLSTIAAGHRIRLTLSSADAPHLQPSVPETANLVGGVYRVQRGAAGPSSVELSLGPVKVPTVKAAVTKPVKHPATHAGGKTPTATPPSGSLAATGLGGASALVAGLLLLAATVLRRRSSRA